MKPIKFNKYIKIEKSYYLYHKCSYCGKEIGKNKLGLNITPPNYSIIIWIHINCIDDFAKDIKKFKKKHIRDIMIESLTEKRK